MIAMPISVKHTGMKDNTAWNDLTESEQRVWLSAGKKPAEYNGKMIWVGDILDSSMRIVCANEPAAQPQEG